MYDSRVDKWIVVYVVHMPLQPAPEIRDGSGVICCSFLIRLIYAVCLNIILYLILNTMFYGFTSKNGR